MITMQVGNITQLTERGIKPLRRKEVEAKQNDVERHEIGLLNALAWRHPHKVLEIAERIRIEALAEENA